MQKTRIDISTEKPDSIGGKKVYRTRIEVAKGAIPGSLFAEIVDAVEEWKRFEEGDRETRYEKFRNNGN